MRRRLVIALAALLSVTLALPGLAAAPGPGVGILTQLAAGDYAAVFDASDAAMQGALVNAEGVGAMWRGILLQFGKYEGAQELAAQEAGGYTTYAAQATFARAQAQFAVVFDAEGKLAGLQVLGVTPREQPQPEPQGETVALRPGAADETKATLFLPEGEGPFPVVILLSGSGPNDKDESAYGMAPFRDLAEGLAASGVGTLRYDKYTLAHKDILAADPERLSSFTMREEYVDDAAAAYAAISPDPRVSGVFLLGHSQGAYAAPRAAAALPDRAAKGVILLSGTPLSIAAIIDRQNRDELARMNLTPVQSAEVTARLDAEQEKITALEGMTEQQLKTTFLFGTLSGWYLRDERENAPAEVLAQLGVPVLVIQGGKDWQVKPEEGILLWRGALAGVDAEFVEFPNMTHFLFDLEGPSQGSAADYLNPKPVSEALMDALAEWILAK